MKHNTFEESLANLKEISKKTTTLPIKEILEILSGNGRLIILIFLSLPFCQPLQIPGLSTPFGIAIAFIGLRIALGKRIWLPKRILLKKISSMTIENISKKSLKMMKKMSRFLHPRLQWLCKGAIFNTINGFLICFLGFFLALPLPLPLTNFVAGWSIVLVSLGWLANDGMIILVGYFVSLITLLYLILILLSIKVVF